MVRKMVAAVLVGGGGGYVVLFGIRKAFACLGHSQKSRQGEGKENRTGKAGNTFLRAWPRNERVEWKMLAHVYFFFFFLYATFVFYLFFILSYPNISRIFSTPHHSPCQFNKKLSTLLSSDFVFSLDSCPRVVFPLGAHFIIVSPPRKAVQ